MVRSDYLLDCGWRYERWKISLRYCALFKNNSTSTQNLEPKSLYMKTKTLAGAFLLLCLIAACTKEGPPGPAGSQGPQGPGGSGTPDPNIFHKWEVVSGLPNTKYVIIKNDNVYYQMDSAAYGFKDIYGATALITGSQIACWSIYNYLVSNDTLYLDNSSETIVLKRNDNAPDETQWVISVTETDSIASPVLNGDGREDIGFDGNNILWTADANSSIIYIIDPPSHAVIGQYTLSTNYSYGQINYAASNIWISNGTTVDKVNPANGSVLATSPSLTSSTLTGIALAGQEMWYSDWQGNIATWDIISNAITPQLQYPVNGMEYVNGYLYMVSGNKIHKCQLSPFKAVATYAIGSANASYSGITHDGSRFWVVKYNYNQNSYSLVKLSI